MVEGRCGSNSSRRQCRPGAGLRRPPVFSAGRHPRTDPELRCRVHAELRRRGLLTQAGKAKEVIGEDNARGDRARRRQAHLEEHPGGYTFEHFRQLKYWNQIMTHARAAHEAGDTATVRKVRQYMNRYGDVWPQAGLRTAS